MEAFEIALYEVPEDVSYIMVEAIDYATNIQTYMVNIKTGDVEYVSYDYGTVEYAVDKILNDKASIGNVVPVQAIITEIYDGIVYVSSIEPVYGNPLGMAINMADKEQVEELHVGDAFVFAGELDNYYGCPRLDNAEITYELYINEAYENDIGDALLNNVYAELIYYPLVYGIGDYVTFDEVMENPAMHVGTIFYTEDLEVIGITDRGDGTVTVSVTDGNYCVDIVSTLNGADAYVGGMVYFGYFVPVYEMGTVQLRPLQDYYTDDPWIMFY